MADDIDATIDKLHAAGATDDEISAIIKEKYGAGNLTQSDSGGLATIAAGKGIPAAAHGLTSLAASEGFPKATGALARGGTTIAGIVHGLYKGNLSEVISAPISGWAAGKGGYFLGKGAQSAAAPVGRMLGRLAPYAQTLSTLGGAQGVGDLAQMADPKRRDIGMLGIGPSVDVPGAEPPVLNALASKLMQLYGRLRP